MHYSGALRRYTSTLAALDVLVNQRITLLSPATWSDRNDREMMALYAERTPGRSVFAYCMAEGDETAHHWQVFADRGAGACVVFSKARLLQAVSAEPAIRHGPVSYVGWRDLDLTGSLDRIPFIKRQVFRAEREYRLIATPGVRDAGPAYNVPIPLDCITSVYVSGEVPVPLFETFERIVRSIPGCKTLRLKHSGLLRNPRWADALTEALAESAAHSHAATACAKGAHD